MSKTKTSRKNLAAYPFVFWSSLFIVIPLLIVYFVAQKWFVEGIDKAGITGE